MSNHTATTTISHQRHRLEQVGEDLPILGFTIAWTIERVLIPIVDLRRILDAHGFDDLAVGEIRQGSAINRALAELAREGYLQDVTNSDEAAMTRKRDLDDYAVYVLIAEHADADRATRDVDFRHRTALKVRYHKKAKADEDPLAFSSPEAEAVLRPLIDRYRQAYTSRDFTAGVLWEIIRRAGAYKLLDQGGVYFLPAPDRAKAEDLVRRMRALVADVATATGRDCSISAFRQINDRDARADMTRHAHSAMLAALRQERKYLREMGDDERTCGQDTVLHHIRTVEELANNAGLYRDLLDLRARDVDAELQHLRDAFTAMLAGAKPSRDPGVAAQAAALIAEHNTKRASTVDPAVQAILDAAARADEDF